jgi:hypothetical protein
MPARGGSNAPSVKVTPVDHAHVKSVPRLPAKPRPAKERLPDKARSLLGELPAKSPQAAKRLKRDGGVPSLLSPEEQAVGPTIWMDTVDQKVEAYNAWRDVGRELVRASQLQHAAMKMSRPAEYQKKPDATTKLLLHPEVTVRFDAALFSLTVARHGQSAPWAAPQLGSCASSARAWRLWALRHSQVEAGPTGRPASASGARARRLQSLADSAAVDPSTPPQVARLLPTVQKLLDPEENSPDAFAVESFPRKPAPPERPGTDEDRPGVEP